MLSVQEEDQDVCMTVSIGVATYPTDGNSIKSLINEADRALYIAKQRGRNQIAMASEVKGQ
jgi:diguanylate cyclase (GGDEF)-like protein